MKDYIEWKYGCDGELPYDILYEAVREAWEQISVRELNELINSIRDRCQAVIDARGGHTK